jgi:hypothetical protein
MFKPSFVHAYSRRMWRWGRVFIPIWIGFVTLFAAAAAVDAAWHLGWGFDWEDALVGVGMIAFGLVFWVLWNGAFKLIRSLNETINGPEVGQDSGSQP